MREAKAARVSAPPANQNDPTHSVLGVPVDHCIPREGMNEISSRERKSVFSALADPRMVQAAERGLPFLRKAHSESHQWEPLAPTDTKFGVGKVRAFGATPTRDPGLEAEAGGPGPAVVASSPGQGELRNDGNKAGSSSTTPRVTLHPEVSGNGADKCGRWRAPGRWPLGALPGLWTSPSVGLGCRRWTGFQF